MCVMIDKQICLQGACLPTCSYDLWPMWLLVLLVILAMFVVGVVALVVTTHGANKKLSRDKRSYRHGSGSTDA